MVHYFLSVLCETLILVVSLKVICIPNEMKCIYFREQMAKLESSVVHKSINALAVHRARENCAALLRKVNNVAFGL